MVDRGWYGRTPGGGGLASRIVAQAIAADIKQGIPVIEAVARSHQTIIDVSQGGQGTWGMGSTVVVLKMDGNDYEIAWVGDSRAYCWGGGALRRLTHDHTIAQCLLDAGVISAQEFKAHPARNRLTQVLGGSQTGKIEVSTVSGRLHPGEQILLCSDGLTKGINEQQIAMILRENGDVQETVDRLIRTALAQGGEDDITVLLIPARPGAMRSTLTKPRSLPTGLWVVLWVTIIAGLTLLSWWLSRWMKF